MESGNWVRKWDTGGFDNGEVVVIGSDIIWDRCGVWAEIRCWQRLLKEQRPRN